MLRLRVIVRLHGSVIEDRVVDVHERVWLGESSRAEVVFPGAHLLVENEAGALWLRGKALQAGEPVTVFLGPVTLHLELVTEEANLDWEGPLPSEWLPIDVRVLVATAAVALFGAFLDSMSRFVETDHQASELIASLISSPLEGEAPTTRTARMPTPEAQAENQAPRPDPAFQPPAVIDYRLVPVRPPASDGGFDPAEPRPVRFLDASDR